ncbi:hypothetical protein FQR65_LT09329 [Abscondita terminalis]|nr:hypothetical protein FQR65_LT09329 [Abscondita terminalis]
MMMKSKLFAFLFCLVFNLHKVNSFCINVLNDEEKECATPLNLDADSIWDMYESDSKNLNFEKYLNCVWLKWGYVDKHGTIMYENLKKSNGLGWRISRICQDVGQLIEQLKIDFQKSANYCEKNRPVIETPATVRRCIAKNYKPTPVHF